MLDLAGVTLCCIDTANPALALRALMRSQAGITFGRILFLTHGVAPDVVVPSGIDAVNIGSLPSRADYSRFVLKSLVKHITTPHVLLVQWDGPCSSRITAFDSAVKRSPIVSRSKQPIPSASRAGHSHHAGPWRAIDRRDCRLRFRARPPCGSFRPGSASRLFAVARHPAHRGQPSLGTRPRPRDDKPACGFVAHGRNVAVHVWVSETRPRMQGARLTAWELRASKVPHTLIVDAAGALLMQQGRVDLILVGADRVAANGDVCNKIGTYEKALAAQDNGVPMYVAVPSSTIDWSLADGDGIPIEERDASEVLCSDGVTAIAPEDTKVFNPGFDVTPAYLLTGLITPTALAYDALQGEDIVEMALDGEIRGTRKPSSEWRFHRDIYATRPEVGAIVHAHSTVATTLSCVGRGIPAFHYMVAVAGGNDVRCAAYATFGTQQLSDHVLTALQDRNACLMANHGMVAIGESPAAALTLAVEVEALAEQYWRALQIGEPNLLCEEEMQAVLTKFTRYGQKNNP